MSCCCHEVWKKQHQPTYITISTSSWYTWSTNLKWVWEAPYAVWSWNDFYFNNKLNNDSNSKIHQQRHLSNFFYMKIFYSHKNRHFDVFTMFLYFGTMLTFVVIFSFHCSNLVSMLLFLCDYLWMFWNNFIIKHCCTIWIKSWIL